MPGFMRDEDGSLIVFALYLFVTMLLIGGMAVDLMRYETHRARLQSTLDRAVLAAASLSQTKTPSEVVLDYFDRADLSAYIDAEDITDTTTLTARQVTAEAEMDMPTTFMKLSGVSDLRAPAGGTAEESASRTEISLVVDVSGSMSWSSSSGYSKIYELRDAATQFVNILMCDPSDPNATSNCTVEPDTVSITLVPYAQQVLAGESVFDQLNVTNEHTNSSCITFDAEDFEDVGIDPLQQYKRTGHFDRATWRTYVSWRECKTDSWRQILPLENEPADLRDAIGDLGASGNTSIDIGLKWGAAFLDPGFQPVVQGLVADNIVDAAFDDRPYSYTENGIKKVIVLMTDGVNTSQYYLYDDYRDGPSGIYYNSVYPSRMSIYRASTDRYYWTYDGSWNDHPYGDGESYVCSGWWWSSCSWQEEPGEAVEYSFPELWENYAWGFYTQFWWLDSPGSSVGNSEKDSRLDDICSAVKDRNITIFSIGFEVTEASAAVMQDCASSAAHYFDVDGTNLTDAFAAIARQISALRLIN